MKNDIMTDLSIIDEAEARKPRMLAKLLDEALKRSGHVLAVKSEMGVALQDTGQPVRIPSYVSVHPLSWVGNKANLKMGSEMPFMEQYIGEDGRIRVDENNANELAQRAPDWTRQPALTAYLLHDHSRKFGTILAVVSPDWIDNPKHENWGPGGVALRSAIDFEPLDSEGKVGLIDLERNHVYALDGQHRVMGIRGLLELQDGRLDIKKSSGAGTSKSLTREQFLSQFDVSVGDLNALMSETISVEYIPAVIRGETREKAVQRVRSIFVAVNSYARRTDKGETILLDEKDGFAIVGRRVALTHPLLKTPDGHSRVNFKNTALPARSNWLTTLQALKEMARVYLTITESDMTKKWNQSFGGAVPLRPPEEELDQGQKAFQKMLDFVAELPSMRDITAGATLDEWREFPPKGKGHLLLRPVGQEVLARAVATLRTYGMSLDAIFEKLTRFDAAGGFEQDDPGNVWWGVTYDGDKEKMLISHKDLAAELLVYLVRGAKSDEKTELLQRVRELRKRADGHWYNFGTKWVPVTDVNADSDLPNPIAAK